MEAATRCTVPSAMRCSAGPVSARLTGGCVEEGKGKIIIFKRALKFIQIKPYVFTMSTSAFVHAII